ncbi:hypothetical protein [Solidesulfovibrio alcoholivorans]|uniref:hypothetical protein n=1 Tax=Solidesulfovibrio alcoholivorans TaxID=81406 RepID=UPI0004950E13|nr:hypothetical protein [Solidesulfovibrio alcoholivorans]
METVFDTQLAAVLTVSAAQFAAEVTVLSSELAAGMALLTAVATDFTAAVTLEKKELQLIFLPSGDLVGCVCSPFLTPL